MLITHRGLSGPAILQISSYWREHSSIRIDLSPGRDATLSIREAKERNLAAARSALQGYLPKRCHALARSSCTAGLEQSRIGRAGTSSA
jgi:predicted flavoprotein YhiN